MVVALPQVCDLHGIPALVQLFSSENRAVLRYAAGATRNLIYENADNKAALVDAGGVARLVGILREPDEELRKTVTGRAVTARNLWRRPKKQSSLDVYIVFFPFIYYHSIISYNSAHSVLYTLIKNGILMGCFGHQQIV